MYVNCFIKRDFNHDLLSISGYYVKNFSHTQYNLFLVMSKKLLILQLSADPILGVQGKSQWVQGKYRIKG